jgi:hypothetical protein
MKKEGNKVTRIRPEDGARPWLPASDVTALAVYHEWNVPLAGLLEQSGNRFVFTCLLGEESASSSVWAYAPASDQEIDNLERLSGDEFADAVDASLANKALVVAFADNDRLSTWHLIDSGEEPPAAIVRRFLERWRISLREQNKHAEEIANSRELVDA